MKKLIRLRKYGKAYDVDFGNNYVDKNNTHKDYEIEIDQNSPLFLLWLTFHDYGAIPRDLIETNKINSYGNHVIGELIADRVKICAIIDKNICFEITADNLKRIWIDYEKLKNRNADEIILERDGDHFSIRGVWFDQVADIKAKKK